jgi:hypothetical protein
MKHLESDRAPRGDLLSPKHAAHAAVTYRLENAVAVVQLPTDQRRVIHRD